jgi:hypothetical protein
MADNRRGDKRGTRIINRGLSLLKKRGQMLCGLEESAVRSISTG